MTITVVRESWRLHPLTWIHRAEARSIAKELRRAGHDVRLIRLQTNSLSDLTPSLLLLRVSDPVMLMLVQALTRVGKFYMGPHADVMARCYDKYEAHRVATSNGLDSPATVLASEAAAIPIPLVLKPRRGSDSIGVRLLKKGPIPARLRTDRHIAQQYIRGLELTVAVCRDRVGMPLRIILPEATPFSFFRKYLLRPPRLPVTDTALAERARRTALEIARVFGVDWAARIDLIHETASDRLRFLECDVAPLIGVKSAFAASFDTAGINRAEQLRMLLNDGA